MGNINKLQPLNRHILIEPHLEKNETNSGVLLPEGFTPEMDKYITARVLSVSQDCKDSLKEACWFLDKKSVSVVVDRSMIEEVSVFGKTHHMILENYVLGVFDSPTLQKKEK